jgi:hypothetical protein
MQHHEHRSGKVGGKRSHEPRQCLDAACGGADDHDVTAVARHRTYLSRVSEA